MCACNGGASSIYTFNNDTPNPQSVSNRMVNVPEEGCTITEEMLTLWKTMLLCVKNTDKMAIINLPLVSVNQMLGIIQSALNYPDNYCYYIPQLEYFRSNVLLRIIENVPECLSE